MDSLATVISGKDWLNALRAWRFYTSCVIKKDEERDEASGHVEDRHGDNGMSCTSNDKETVDDSSNMTEQDPSPQVISASEPVPNNIEPTPEPVHDHTASHPLPGSVKSLKLDSSISKISSDTSSDPMPLELDPIKTLEPDSVAMKSDLISQPSKLFPTIADEFKGNTFRVTATRTGPKPAYTSSDAARRFATGVIDSFNWPVKLKNSDIEILLTLDDDDVMVGLALTRTSKHRRNLTFFGPTSLRATIAYGLLRYIAYISLVLYCSSWVYVFYLQVCPP